MTARTEPRKGTGRFDLTLTRIIDAPPELVWRAWTDPEHLKRWWAPAPWTTVDCELELRPGGAFRTVMRDPEGAEFPNDGAILDVVENERIVFTDVLEAGFRPAKSPFFIAIITLEALADGGTRYTARALHKNEVDCKKHEEMGFHDGWGKCADQLAAVARGLKGSE
jgi:uncharacterized protein YndB with AHSA1/START domain